jgi:hypothetical protein
MPFAFQFESLALRATLPQLPTPLSAVFLAVIKYASYNTSPDCDTLTEISPVLTMNHRVFGQCLGKSLS